LFSVTGGVVILVKLTNIGLVEHAKRALKESWGYVYGTYGKILTDVLLNQKLKQYPDNVQKYLDFIKGNWLGRRTADCVGLIKSYVWWDGNDVKYDSKTDVSANGMFDLAKRKGTLDTIPEVPGLCVWRNGHIGIYIGNGQVIESKGTKYGVVQTPLRGTGSNNWTHWLECPFIEYVTEEKKDYKQIIREVTSSPDEWLEAVDIILKLADIGDIGKLKIFKYFPELIEKIYDGAKK